MELESYYYGIECISLEWLTSEDSFTGVRLYSVYGEIAISVLCCNINNFIVKIICIQI